MKFKNTMKKVAIVGLFTAIGTAASALLTRSDDEDEYTIGDHDGEEFEDEDMTDEKTEPAE